MSKAALYAEQRLKIPVIDTATKLWHVRWYEDLNWHDASFTILKDASYFYDKKYLEYLNEYKAKHNGDVVDPKQLSLFSQNQNIRGA